MRRMKTGLLLVFMLVLATSSIFAQGTITPPKFGQYTAGDDYFLANYTQLVDYWGKLAKESDRMKLVEIGKTSEGRAIIMAIITAPANFKKLDRYKEISQRLARAEGLNDEQARALATEGKSVVWIDGGLHATECVPAQHLFTFAYQMVSQSDPETLRILNDDILLLVPVNPDGMESGLELVYAGNRSGEALHGRAPRALQQIRRARRQPRLLHVEPVGDRPQSGGRCSSSGFRRSCTTSTSRGRLGRSCLLRLSGILSTTTMTRLSRWASTSWVLRFTTGSSPKGSRARLCAPRHPIRPGSTAAYGPARDSITRSGSCPRSSATPRPWNIPFVPSRFVPNGNQPYPIMPQTWHMRQSIDYLITADRAILDIASKMREDFLYRIYVMGQEFDPTRQPGFLDHHAQTARCAARGRCQGPGRASRARRRQQEDGVVEAAVQAERSLRVAKVKRRVLAAAE